MEDIEIAKKIKLKPIKQIANEMQISEKYVILYGKDKAKIDKSYYSKLENVSDGKLILVTAMSPTPLGEGKTTISIGLADALRKINKSSILALREPSMGPVFGMKGGATGGGYAQIAPMVDINLHFTGDIHAITSANNLLAAMIDNHIYFGNELKFKKVIWKRCLDVNDRALRKIQINLSNEKNNIPREDGFDISVASEIMAIFCLATSLRELEQRIGNIIIGYNEVDEPILAKDLKAEGAMTAILKDAFNPNLVQTLEGTPALIHGGPFANIAHGCNSIVATKMALKLADYTITEAGFGADLGAEKFIDIKCRNGNIAPSAVVCVATIKALKYHGGVSKENIKEPNIEAVKEGIKNLKIHIKNIKENYGLNVVVAINKYEYDIEEEIDFLKSEMEQLGVELSLVEAWAKGGNGAIDLANKVMKVCEKEADCKYVYELGESIQDKIKKIATKIYLAKDVEYSSDSIAKIKSIEKMGYGNLPICIAKTQYSLSDNPKILNTNENYNIHVQDVQLKAGAGFIVVITNNIYTMPGLPKTPAAEKIGIDLDENVYGIF